MGLISTGRNSVPRVESCSGVVVGTFVEDTPALPEHLGEARPYLDYWIHRGGSGADHGALPR